MTDNPLDSAGDPFGPPGVSVEVECLHCGQRYDSYLIEWRIITDVDGNQHGFWCCPTPDCGGMGFGFDIFPTDPNYQDEHGGWMHCDDDYDEEISTRSSTPTPSTKSSRPTPQQTAQTPAATAIGRPKLVDEGDDQIPY